MNNKKLVLITGIILGIFILLLIGNLNYNLKTTGRVVQDVEISEQAKQIAEQIANEEIVSNVDVRKKVDLEVKDKLFEKNKVMEFDTEKGKITINIDKGFNEALVSLS